MYIPFLPPPNIDPGIEPGPLPPPEPTYEELLQQTVIDFLTRLPELIPNDPPLGESL